MSKVSIIIPVFKVEKYLNRCLDSIINQTFSDFEIILIDDCSPDKSGKICDEYLNKDSRIKVIHCKQNGGLSVARNIGLEICNGEYIAFVDSDDYIESCYLENLIKHLEESNADIVQCGFCEVVNGEKKVLLNNKKSQCEIYTKEQAFNFLFGDGDCNKLNFIVWNKLFKKSIVNDIRFEEGMRNEDVVYVSKSIAKITKIAVFEEQLYYYCRHDDSIMGKMQKDKSDMILSHICAYRKVAESVTNCSPYIQQLCNSMLATWYVSAIKQGVFKNNKQLKVRFKEDKRCFKFLKNKRVPFLKRFVLMIGG